MTTIEKRPHRNSKEGRALREQAKLAEASIVTETESTVTETQVTPIVEKTEAPKSNDQMTYVLEEISKLKAENENLKSKITHPWVKWKEINQESKLFSYKMRGGVPVLTYVSKRRDPSKDFVYKNQYWQFESNHTLVLSLADGSTIDVDVVEFNRDFDRSEKMVCKNQYDEYITNENIKFVKEYRFTDNWMTFTVLPNAIN